MCSTDYKNNINAIKPKPQPKWAVDKKHNRAGPGQIYGKYRRFRGGSTEFIEK